jgi:hypothetical protein
MSDSVLFRLTIKNNNFSSDALPEGSNASIGAPLVMYAVLVIV